MNMAGSNRCGSLADPAAEEKGYGTGEHTERGGGQVRRPAEASANPQVDGGDAGGRRRRTVLCSALNHFPYLAADLAVVGALLGFLVILIDIAAGASLVLQIIGYPTAVLSFLDSAIRRPVFLRSRSAPPTAAATSTNGPRAISASGCSKCCSCCT